MSHEKTISDLAYHLWRARGCPNGSAEVDWAEAERQVRGIRFGSGRALDPPLPVTERAASTASTGASSVADPPPLKPAAVADPPGIRAKKKAKR